MTTIGGLQLCRDTDQTNIRAAESRKEMMRAVGRPQKDAEDDDQRIKALEEKIKQLEEQARESSEGRGEGAAQSFLKGLGSSIPGLGGLLEAMTKSEAFSERLKEVEEAVEARLRGEEPPPTPERRRRGARGLVPRGIPPRTVGGRTPAPPGRKEARPKEVPADIFDEEDLIGNYRLDRTRGEPYTGVSERRRTMCKVTISLLQLFERFPDQDTTWNNSAGLTAPGVHTVESGRASVPTKTATTGATSA